MNKKASVAITLSEKGFWFNTKSVLYGAEVGVLSASKFHTELILNY